MVRTPEAPFARIVGRVVRPDGTAAAGRLTLTPDAQHPNATLPGGEVVVVPSTVVDLDGEGRVASTVDGVPAPWVDVIAPGGSVEPAGSWTYTVTLSVPGSTWWSRHVTLTQGTVVDLTDLAPAAEYRGDAVTIAEGAAVESAASAAQAAASAAASERSAAQSSADVAAAREAATSSASAASSSAADSAASRAAASTSSQSAAAAAESARASADGVSASAASAADSQASARASEVSASAAAESAGSSASAAVSARESAAASAASSESSASSSQASQVSAREAAASLAQAQEDIAAGKIKGADGRGVTSITNPGGDTTATVTYTDGETQDLPLPTVAQPSFTAGTVSTVPAGGAATATVSGAYPDLKLNFGLVTGQPDDYRIVGVGRPDVSGSMSSAIAARVAAAPVGCEFISTDGPQGAWRWQKTTAGWVVTLGDTGWRDITGKIAFSDSVARTGIVRVRRTPEHFIVRVNSVSAVTIPHQDVTALPAAGWWDMNGVPRLHSVITAVSSNLTAVGYVDLVTTTMLIKVSGTPVTDAFFPPASTWPTTLP